MQIYVQKADGKKLTLTVDPMNTIDQVKDMVEAKEKIPKKKQILTYEGKTLDNKPTLADYKVKHLGTLYLEEPLEKAPITPEPDKKKFDVEVSGWGSPMDYVGGKAKSKAHKGEKYEIAESRLEPSYLAYKQQREKEKAEAAAKSPKKK